MGYYKIINRELLIFRRGCMNTQFVADPDEYYNKLKDTVAKKLNLKQNEIIFNNHIAGTTDDRMELHDFKESIRLRLQSYTAAAKLIVNNGQHPDPEIIKRIDVYFAAVNEQINNFKPGKKSKQDNEILFAYLKAFTDRVIEDFRGVIFDKDTKPAAIRKSLENAEALVNIKQRPPVVTCSGFMAAGEFINIQIAQPRNRFCDLTEAQQNEWLLIYFKFTQGKHLANSSKQYNLGSPELMAILPGKINQATVDGFKYPEWFNKLALYERNFWKTNLNEIITQAIDAKQPCQQSTYPFTPVVKKIGIPGLRNAKINHAATVVVPASPKDEIYLDLGNGSLSTSHVVGQAKEGTEKLSDSEQKITDDNLRQAWELGSNQNNNIWKIPPDVIIYILYQTLVRNLGGGDDWVNANTDAATKRINEEYANTNPNRKAFHTNHCIGLIPTPLQALRRAYESTSTQGMEHIQEPMQSFINIIVPYTINNNPINQAPQTHTAKKMFDWVVGEFNKYLNDQMSLAMKGELNKKSSFLTGVTKWCSATHMEPNQIKELCKIFQAVNEYALTNHQKHYDNNYQLHLAGLEEIIYLSTGNISQGNCKSGKDRKGVEGTYRSALLRYYNQYGEFPPAAPDTEGRRKEFIRIFVEMFVAGHEAIMSEFNAAGCRGQKALKAILPGDIYQTIKQEHPGYLITHKTNAATNVSKQKVIGTNAEAYAEVAKQLDEIKKSNIVNLDEFKQLKQQEIEVVKQLRSKEIEVACENLSERVHVLEEQKKDQRKSTLSLSLISNAINAAKPIVANSNNDDTARATALYRILSMIDDAQDEYRKIKLENSKSASNTKTAKVFEKLRQSVYNIAEKANLTAELHTAIASAQKVAQDAPSNREHNSNKENLIIKVVQQGKTATITAAKMATKLSRVVKRVVNKIVGKEESTAGSTLVIANGGMLHKGGNQTMSSEEYAKIKFYINSIDKTTSFRKDLAAVKTPEALEELLTQPMPNSSMSIQEQLADWKEQLKQGIDSTKVSDINGYDIQCMHDGLKMLAVIQNMIDDKRKEIKQSPDVIKNPTEQLASTSQIDPAPTPTKRVPNVNVKVR